MIIINSLFDFSFMIKYDAKKSFYNILYFEIVYFLKTSNIDQNVLLQLLHLITDRKENFKKIGNVNLINKKQMYRFLPIYFF